MKKGKAIPITIIAIILTIAIFLALCPIINNASANKVVDDILSIPLPEDTLVVEEFSKAGKLTGNGNGNGMQFQESF